VGAENICLRNWPANDFVNGTYTLNGTYNSKERWTANIGGNSRVISWSTAYDRWAVGHSNGDVGYGYYNDENADPNTWTTNDSQLAGTSAPDTCPSPTATPTSTVTASASPPATEPPEEEGY
jgi:hypothetical protein